MDFPFDNYLEMVRQGLTAIVDCLDSDPELRERFFSPRFPDPASVLYSKHDLAKLIVASGAKFKLAPEFGDALTEYSQSKSAWFLPNFCSRESLTD